MVHNTVRERILLHLRSYTSYRNSKEVPYEISQPGMADAVGVSRPHLSLEIRKLMDEDIYLLDEKVRHVKGMKRKRKVYFLTGIGIQRAGSLRKRLESEKVTVFTDKGRTELTLGDIHGYVKGIDPMLKALVSMGAGSLLDLRHEKVRDLDVLVGRDRELEELKDALDRVKETGSELLFIIGDPGIGKTRLVSELGKNAVEKGFRFLTGKAYFKTSDPYLPFKKAFEDLSADDTPLSSAYLHNPGPRAEDEEMFRSQRGATFFEIAKDMRRLAHEKPMVIFLDDIQWADGATLQMLHYLSGNLDDSPVLLVCAFRPRDRWMNEMLKEVCTRLRREGRFMSMELKPLEVEHARDMITNVLDVTGIPHDFVTVIHDITQGNPLFVKECTKGLVEQGLLDPENDVYPLKETEIVVPNMVTGMIQRRFDQLPKDTKRVLELGSVIGEDINFDLLVNASGMNEFELFDHVDILLGANIWGEEPNEDTFRFSHALVNMAAYKAISSIKRRKLHGKIAKCMKELYGEKISDNYSSLSYHLSESGDYAEAVKYLTLAGEQAESVYAHEDALDMYGKALALADRTSSVDKKALLERLGDVNKILGNYEQSKEHYKRSMEFSAHSTHHQRIYRKLGDIGLKQCHFDDALDLIEKGLSLMKEETTETCRLLEVKGWVLMQVGGNEEAVKVFNEEMEIAERLKDDGSRRDALHNLGTMAIRAGNITEGEELLRSAILLGEKVGDDRGLAKSYNNMGVVHKAKGELDLALEAYGKSLDIDEKIGDKSDVAGSYANIGNILYIKGETQEALRYHESSLEMFTKLDDKRGKAVALNNIGLLKREFGDMEEAMEYNRRSLEIREAINDKQGIALSLSHIGSILKEKGDLEGALECFERAKDIFTYIGDTLGSAATAGNIGEVLLYQGKQEEAHRRFVAVLKDLTDVKDLFETARARCRLAESFLQKDSLEEAREHARRGLEMSHEIGAILGLAIAHRLMGIITAKEGNIQEASVHFQKSMDLLVRTGRRPEVARCLLEEGKVRLASYEDERGLEMVEEALRMYEKMNMDHWVERCKEVLSSA